jgi:hypothetical protein
MIRKVEGGYAVFSKKGKKLTKAMSKEGAEARLREIEYYKHKDRGSAEQQKKAFI